MGRRIDAQTDDVLELDGELGVLGQLEALDVVRLQAVRSPDPLDQRSEMPVAAAITRPVQ
jgi:hypothetical protein